MKIYEYIIKTEVGNMKIYFDSEYVYYIAIPNIEDDAACKYLKDKLKDYEIIEDIEINKALDINLDIMVLDKYFQGEKVDLGEIKIKTFGTDFQEKVWKACLSVEYGDTASYGDLSEIISNKGYQAIGGALGKNPIPIIIPCHRIVGKDGGLTGYAGGLDVKKYLLNLEENNIL